MQSLKNFILVIASILDFAGVLGPHTPKYDSDREALASDWQALTDDWKRVIDAS